MSFITEPDLYRSLRKQYIDELKRDDATLIDEAISAALAEISSYLSDTFDMQLIFAQTDANRDPLLKMFAVDITIYNVLSVAAPGSDIEQKRLRRKSAIDWLLAVKDGKLQTTLPKLENSPAQNVIIYGSVTRKNTRY